MYYNMLRPWIQEAKGSFHSLALVVPGKKLVTLANNVEKAGLIEVSQYSSYKKTLARVIHIDKVANLALLSVEKPSFFKKLAPLPLGKDSAPGKTLSAARIDKLFHVYREKLHVKEINLSSNTGFTDLPFYSFHSQDHFPLGGLLLDRNKLCGLISYSDRGGEGQAILTSILQSFLQSYRKKGKGFPKRKREYYESSFISQGFRLKNLVDPVKQSYYKVPYKDQGALVSRVLPGTSAWPSARKILQNGDVLLSIDSIPVDNLGLYEDLRKGKRKGWGRQNAELLLTMKKGRVRKAREVAKLRILRKGKKMQLKMKLKSYQGRGERIPSQVYGLPNYFIENGIVFLEMSVPLLSSLYGKKWREKASQASYLFETQRYYKWPRGAKKKKEKRRIVMIGDILPDASTRGLRAFRGAIVEKIKDKELMDLKSLYTEILRLTRSARSANSEQKKVLKLLLYGGRPLYLDLEKGPEINRRILKRYSIPALSSWELRARAFKKSKTPSYRKSGPARPLICPQNEFLALGAQGRALEFFQFFHTKTKTKAPAVLKKSIRFKATVEIEMPPLLQSFFHSLSLTPGDEAQVRRGL